MKFGSLFAGIGGIDLGLERAGMQCAWQVEIDEYCLKVLEKHWPDVPKYKDVCTVTRLPYVDLICGGFPCQSISQAGNKKGTKDERWLWPEFERIIRMVRPRYIFVENVPSLIHRGMSEVLGDLASCGYDAEWQSISASAFGAPHKRERIFIIAYIDSNRELQQERRIFDKWKRSIHSHEWPTSPMVARENNGVSSRVVRLLGNAVVPQVAEWIGRRIMEYDNSFS